MTVLPAEDTPFGARVRTRLTEETVVWFTTVGNDGTPQPNPVWFLWDGDTETALVYNRADAHRIGHVRARPTVSLNFDGNGRGGDIVVLRGNAEVLADAPPATATAAYLAKYAEQMARVSGSAEEFAAAYPVAIRVTVTGVRGF